MQTQSDGQVPARIGKRRQIDLERSISFDVLVEVGAQAVLGVGALTVGQLTPSTWRGTRQISPVRRRFSRLTPIR